MIKTKLSIIKYWLRITTDCDVPELVKDAYALVKSESHEWANYIHKILNDSGFPQVWSQMY